MKIPPGAKLITDNRLSAIRVVKTLYDSLIAAEDKGLIDQVKAAMKKKRVTYAESDHAIARLQPGGRSSLDAKKVFALIKAGKLTADEFCDACTVWRKPLEAKLTGDELQELTTWTAGSPSLITEFKPGVQIDCPSLAYMLTQSLQREPDRGASAD